MYVHVRKLPIGLIFTSIFQTQIPPAVPGEIQLATSVASPALPASNLVASLNIAPHLASCSAGANVNACATDAANQAKARGLALYFPAGIYPLSAWAPPCPLVIVGDGTGRTIFKRPANSPGSVISSTNCGGLQISNLTVDGNKANNSAIGYTVVLRGDWNLTLNNVEIKDSKGSGSALTVQSTADDSNDTHSILSKLYIHDNDGNGVFLQKHAWNWTLEGSEVSNNGGAGVTVIDFVFPPETAQFSNCAIVHNDISNNTGNGISVTSGFSGGTAAAPINGLFKTVQNCKIVGNQVNHNSHYGIIMTGGHNIEIASNVATHNGANTGTFAAGINSALCDECDVHDNTVQYNAFYGIDAGGAADTKVHHNVISNNGNSIANNGNGINCGACRNVEIADNLIANNGWTAGGAQIHVTSYDGGVSGFALSAQDDAIRRNHLICTNSNEVGLQVLSDPPRTTVEDNWTEGCTTFKGYVLHTTNAQVHGNREDNWTNGVTYTASGANETVVYPDAAEDVAFTSASPNVIAALTPYFYSTNYQTVYAIVVTEGGNGYSTAPSVRFSGGDCASEPTGSVFQDNNGHVVGINLTSFGSGCTRAPTVSFADSAGYGASATAFVLTALPIDGRTLNVLWPSGLTVTHNPNQLSLLGGVKFTVPGRLSYRSRMRGQDNHWIEIHRDDVAQ